MAALPKTSPPVDVISQRAASSKGLLLDPTARVWMLTNNGAPSNGDGNGWTGKGSMVIDVSAGNLYIQTGPITATTWAAAGGGSGAPINTVAPAVTGTTTVGSVLTTTNGTWTGSPTGYAYQWQWADTGAPITGATSSTYTLVTGDVGHTIDCIVTASYIGGITAQSNATGAVTGSGNVPIGGYAVGDQGANGTIYQGFTMSYGDDFLGSLDIVGPANPKGKYFPVRLPPFQGTGTKFHQRAGIAIDSTGTQSLQISMLTDPAWTGWLDNNKGVPVGCDNVRQSASVLTLQSRAAKAAENAAMIEPDGNLNLSCEVHGVGACAINPTSGAPCIIDFYMQVTPSQATQPIGGEQAHWVRTVTPVTNSAAADEVDIYDNTVATAASVIAFNKFTWNSSGVPTLTGTVSWSNTPPNPVDGTWHLVSCIFDPTGPTIKAYLDGVLLKTLAFNPNTLGKPIAYLIENFLGQTGFSQSVWNALGTGQSAGILVNTDYVRVWRTTGQSHFKPAVAIADTNVAYAGTATVVFPDALTLWGDNTVTEYVALIPFEPNCPGASASLADLQVWGGQFPTAHGVTCTAPNMAGSRTLTVVQSSGANTGRLHGFVHAYNAGCTLEPVPFTINFGPNVKTFTIKSSNGIPGQFDAYYYADVGIITPKVFSLSGQPAGVSIDSATGIITWDNTVTSSTTYTLTVTNSVGQSASSTVTHTVVTTAANYMGQARAKESVALTHTFAAMPIGPAYATRSVLVSVVCRNATDTLACTIGGVSATAIASVAPGGSNDQIYLFGAAVPTGTTADVVITAPTNILSRINIAVYTAPLTSLVASNVASTSTITTQALSVSSNVPANGIVIAANNFSLPALQLAWTGVKSGPAPFENLNSNGVWTADFAATVGFGCDSIPAGNAALTVKNTYTLGYVNSAVGLGQMLSVTLA